MKEAFALFDQDNDGIISREDLREMLMSVGQETGDDYIDKMISDARGPLNFTVFLTMMSEKLDGFDTENDLQEAFKAFEEKGDGLVNVKELQEALLFMGDRLSQQQLDYLFKDISVDQNGKVDYNKLIGALKNDC
ncbi:hypothetical protein BB561_002794 [Smittium simulii]|uniref:EF-hand domain-containing protein n=1 Tax=Smittium simulii TaxID=133385 RepID=A0A2T9YP64_9FUNG|nr:hypothetical protein BB561_002794 [Smittium simulii]